LVAAVTRFVKNTLRTVILLFAMQLAVVVYATPDAPVYAPWLLGLTAAAFVYLGDWKTS
jgi:hypothetical protein